MPQSLSNLIMHLKPYWLSDAAAVVPLVLGEGPDIDIVGSTIGRGGDKILKFDSGGDPVAEYAATEAGLILAIAAVAAGDRLWFPEINITVTQAITIPANITIDYADITFSGFSGVGMTLQAQDKINFSNIYFDGTGQASATAIKTTAQCKIYHTNGIAYYATNSVGIWALGNSRYERAHIVASIGDARHGDNNFGLRMDDYSFAQSSLGFAQTTGTGTDKAYGLQHYSTLAGEDGGFTLACSGAAWGSAGSTVAVGAIWSAGKTGREASSHFYSVGGNTNTDLVIEAGATATISHCSYNTSSITGTLVIIPGDNIKKAASSTDHAVVRWDGTNGDTVQNSSVIMDDSGNTDFQSSQIRDYAEQTVATSQGANYDIDWAAGNLFEVTLTGNVTFTFSNLVAGKGITVTLIQDGSGNRTATWPGAVTWLPAAPILQTAASAIDVVTFFVRNDGASVLGFAGQAVVSLALDDLTDVDTTGVGTGDIIYKSAGDWIDYPLGIGTDIVNDGSSIKIGDNAGGNYFSVDLASGEIGLNGNATVFEDVRVEPVVRQAAGAGVPSFEKYFDDAPGTSKGVYLLSFTDEAVAGNEKEVFFNMQMPHTWKIGSDIHMHVHFVPAATVNSSDIIWGLEYTWKSNGEIFGDTTIIQSSTTLLPDDANITAGKHYIAEFADISPGPTASSLSSILIGRLFRNSSVAGDTYTNKVGLLYIDAHYEVDSLGSTEEYTKTVLLADSDGETLLDSDGVELTE